MKKLADRVKLRREYLERRNMGNLLGVAFGCVSIAAFMVAILIHFWFLRPDYDGYDGPDYRNLMQIAIMVVTIGGPACIGICFAWGSVSVFKIATAIPYVPSVEEQLPNLPAEEVLLRGSQVAPVAPEELLRPAGGQETAKDELLRATTGGTAE